MRHAIFASLVLVFAIASAGSASAQCAGGAQSRETTVRLVEDQLLQMRFGAFSSALTRAGKTVEVGFFGAQSAKVFAGSPRALAEADGYRTYRLAGTPLYAVGLGLLVADLILLGAKHSSVYDSASVQPLAWALLGSGAAVGLTGAFLIQAANGRLSEAARLYNEDVFARARQGLRVGLVPIQGGLAAGFGASF